MKATRILPLLLAGGMLSATTVLAATPDGPVMPQPAEAPVVQHYHHASTLAEGFLRGRADVVRAWGQAYYNVNAGKVLREEARRRYIENKKYATQVYFERKRINKEYRDANRRQPLSTDQLADIAHRAAPNRLTSHEYDRTSANIQWPTLLEDARFDGQRVALERLFAERSTGDDNGSSIRNTTSQMKVTLKGMIDEVAPTTYVAARRFLDSMSYESRFVAAPLARGLAMSR